MCCYTGLLAEHNQVAVSAGGTIIFVRRRSLQPPYQGTMEKYADKLEFLIKALWIAHFREWIAQL